VTDVAELERRIGVLEDKAAIQDVKYRYWQGLDRRLPDEVRECFDPRGVIIDFGEWGRFDDREDFIKTFIKEECVPHVIDTHHGHNFRVTLTGKDSARAVTDLYHAQARTDLGTFTIEGAYYEDEFVRYEGRWWIKKLVYRVISEVAYEVKADGVLKTKKLGV
jgi:hypothetical protein